MAGLGRKSQELSQRGIVEKHGYGWRAHFAHIRICEEKDTFRSEVRCVTAEGKLLQT